jgi:hypothetical protein
MIRVYTICVTLALFLAGFWGTGPAGFWGT